MTWPAIIFWLLIIGGAFTRGPFMLYLFLASGAFGGLSLLPPGALGNVPAYTICAATFIAKSLAERRHTTTFLALATDGSKLGILGLFCIYIVVTTFLYPRFFAGEIQLYALNFASNISFLAPTSSNITQSIYMLISIAMTFVFADYGRSPIFREQFLRAMLVAACVLVTTGLIDAAIGAAGREDLLAPFHTATYHLLNTVTTGGQRRVVGFMPEASSFGGDCCWMLAFLLFNLPFYRGIFQHVVVPATMLALIYLIYASTSSGAYIGIALLFAIYAARFTLQLIMARDITRSYFGQIYGALILVVVLVAIGLSLPQATIAHFRLLLDDTLFQKSYSSSYIERNSWTQAGIAAFFKSHCMGVGVGSVRTSNWFVNFAASVGIPGIILFGGFVFWMLLPSPNYADTRSRKFATALKLSLIPTIFVKGLSGTTPDPGADMMMVLGLIYALRQKPYPLPRRSSTTAPLPETGVSQAITG